jgi:phosphatidylglycerol lysyltransferase
VLRLGWNATAYQIINPGIDHWFSSAGDAVAGFVEWGGMRVVAGAPVCSAERLAAVVAEFERDAAGAGRAVCYFGAEKRLESVLRDTPEHSMVLLGAQPAWHPAVWEDIITGRASLRGQLNRARNKSVTVSQWSPEQATGHPELARVLGEWLGSRGLPPLHFLVEPRTLERLADRKVFVAELKGEVVGFLVASPVPVRNGWLIEQNIRGRKAPNGTVELMIDAAIRWMASAGSDYVTLGLSPLSSRAGTAPDLNPFLIRLILSWLRAHGRRFYNFDGLDAFKAKFQPEWWEPVYAISNRRNFSLRSLYAIAAAFTGGAPAATGLRAIKRALGQEAEWMAEKVLSS